MSKKHKKKQLLFAAINLAEANGYENITREMIATKAGVGLGTVNLYFGTMHKLKKTIISHALRTGNNKIVAQAILNKDDLVSNLSTNERKTALLAVA